MGSKAVQPGAVHLDNVRSPAEYLIGDEGQGVWQVMHGFDFACALMGLQCIGVAQVTGMGDVIQGIAFDKPLSKNQGVRLRWLRPKPCSRPRNCSVTQTLWLKDAGLPHTAQAAMCKWWAPLTAYAVIRPCLLLHGQFGYRTELPVSNACATSLGLQIGDGTAQIMKLIIARQCVGEALAP